MGEMDRCTVRKLLLKGRVRRSREGATKAAVPVVVWLLAIAAALCGLVVVVTAAEESFVGYQVPDSLGHYEQQWQGGVVVNQTVYGIPHSAYKVLSFHPGTKTISGSDTIPNTIYTGDNVNNGNNKWLGGVVINDIIYGIPFSANKVLLYNPASSTISASGAIPSTIDTGKNQ